MNCRSKRRGATHRRRLLQCERLEPRFLLAGDESAPGVFYTDVDGDGQVTIADAMMVIHALNAVATSQGGEGESAAMLVMALPPPPVPSGDAALPYITKAEVENLLARAAG